MYLPLTLISKLIIIFQKPLTDRDEIVKNATAYWNLKERMSLSTLTIALIPWQISFSLLRLCFYEELIWLAAFKKIGNWIHEEINFDRLKLNAVYLIKETCLLNHLY